MRIGKPTMIARQEGSGEIGGGKKARWVALQSPPLQSERKVLFGICTI